MEALVNQLWGFVEAYGVEIALLSLATIFLVGVVKLIFKKGFARINTNVKKAIYETLSLVFAYALTILWMYARTAWFNISTIPFDWVVSLKAASVTMLAVKAMYPVYENYGIRALVRLIGKFIASWFKKKDTNSAVAKNDTNSTDGPVNL